MKRFNVLYLPVLLLMVIPVPALGDTEPGVNFYFNWMRNNLDALEQDLPAITRAAEAAAERYVTGNWQIAAAGDLGIVGEAVGRSGGIMAMKWGYPLNYLDHQEGEKVIVLFALRGDRYERHLNDAKEHLGGDDIFLIAIGSNALLERAVCCRVSPARKDAGDAPELCSARRAGTCQTTRAAPLRSRDPGSDASG